MFMSVFRPIYKCDVSIGTARVYVEIGKDGNFSKKKATDCSMTLGRFKNQRDC